MSAAQVPRLDVRTAIRTRRSHKLFSGGPIADPVLAELVELATWAPNHKFTEPWRFTVLPHRSLALLADAVEAALRDEHGLLTARSTGQVEKIRAIVLGAGGAICVRQQTSPADPFRDREDYAACACAIQNIQLAAWSQGIAGYWTTSAALIGPPLHGFWSVAAGEAIVGLVLLGAAQSEMKPVRYKTPAELTIWREPTAQNP